jgi:hypothetical protein
MASCLLQEEDGSYPPMSFHIGWVAGSGLSLRNRTDKQSRGPLMKMPVFSMF